jgi:hypothetical protein
MKLSRPRRTARKFRGRPRVCKLESVPAVAGTSRGNRLWYTAHSCGSQPGRGMGEVRRGQLRMEVIV